ncbi:class I SAM-dependent methyltransferase [Microlunatus speluncae]|uniref:class I SAM-dependent methyltransferase n=1 Tax=Microlunatus speluncae TaxID=2594267 RepID=UPI0012665D8A|nr:class I SAM-dependent methyltransferase [Microlunatus speluncae]
MSAISGYSDIPGWFWWIDRQLFATILEVQAGSAPGVLVELGTYLGKSAVIIGQHLRPSERFVVLDLFGRTDLLTDTAADRANRTEAERSYPTLTRRTFEQNYLALHDQLPEIVEAPSTAIVEAVEPDTVRFLHVDASHLYAYVREDARNAKSLLRGDGVVVFDDWRGEHTPGVTAAVFESVFADGLIPFALTPTKFYGVFGDPEPYLAAVRHLIDSDDRVWGEEQEILGRPVPRLNLIKQKEQAKTGLSDADIDRISDRLFSRLQPALNGSRTDS